MVSYGLLLLTSHTATISLIHLVVAATLAALGDEANRSVSVVVLLSRALVTLDHYRFILTSLLKPELHQHTIVFVVLEKDWEQAWREHMVGVNLGTISLKLLGDKLAPKLVYLH